MSDLYAESPAPLEIFERTVIHEDNQRLLDERLEMFKPILKGRELRRLRGVVKRLRKRLQKAGYNRLVQHEYQLRIEYSEIKQQYADLKRCLPVEESPLKQEMRAEMQRLKETALAICDDGKSVQAKIALIEPVYHEYRDAMHRIEAHETALKERRAQIRQERQYVKESKIMLSLIKDVLRHSPGCHNLRYEGNKRICEIPRLVLAGFNGDSHWFRLEGSVKGYFGWSQVLPYGVHIDNLISEKTLHNMSVALGRQVEARKSPNGTQIYFVVNRLDSPDGLPRLVRFRSMFEFYPLNRHSSLPYPAGVLAHRKVEWKDFESLPHMLIAGSSQTGKSNQVNCIIATLVQMNSPAECGLVLIDNKAGVEFGFWEELPHLITPMVKDIENVLPALDLVVNIMHRRFNILQATKAKKFSTYNAKVSEKSRWRRIVIFVDEMASLIAHKEITERVHSAMNQIAAMGRATGIHLVISTQYPNTDMLPTQVKANLSVTMTGAMPSGTASMSALGTWDAKELPRIPGRMLLSIGAEMEPVQTAFISDEDIEHAVFVAKKFGAAPPLHELEGPDSENYVPLRTLTVDDVIRIAINERSGRLSAKDMHKYLADDSPGERTLSKLMKRITVKDSVTFEGKTYRVAREGRAYFLTDDDDNDDNDTHTVHENGVASPSLLEEVLQ